MKKKMMSILLAASMVICLTACGGEAAQKSAESKNQTAADTAKTEETVISEEESEEDSNFNPTGYPVVNEPVVLTVMGPTDTARGTTWSENTAWAELARICGVEFEFKEVPKEEFSEQLSIVLASGDLPDIILPVGMSKDDITNNVKAGNFIDMAPYIDAYGENIKYYMENLEGFRQGITSHTGEIASLPYINMSTETGKCPASLFLFYKPWLDKLGLEVPKTAEEFYDVLVAFKEQDPNGNGQQDEIPFLPRNINNMYELWSMFGVIVQQSNYVYADGDEIKFSPFMPEFKEGLKFITKLYKQGLIYKEIYTANQSQVLAVGSGEVAVAGSTISGAAFSVVGEERNADMVLAPEVAAEGATPVWLNRTIVNPGRFVITKHCEYPEVALRVWDYMFSEEGAKLMWMGPESNYTYNDDGSWNWNLAEGQTVEEMRGLNTIQTSISMASAFPQDWFKQNDETEGIANEYRYLMGTEYANNLRLTCPALSFDADVAAEQAIIATDLNAYVNNTIAQFITGELDIDKDWEAFEKQCNSLRLDEYLTNAQAAYDVYRGM